MTALIPGLAGALVVAGLLGLSTGLRRTTRPTGATRPAWARRRRLSDRTRLRLGVGLALGVLGWLVTGWAIALVLAPAIVVGLPALLATPRSATEIARLEAMEEWTRSLAGVLTVSVGLEQALVATLRSAPAPIAEEISRLVARLRARWITEEALQAFADDLDHATGDVIAANLLLGARRRGAGLADVLDALAESVAADVRRHRQTEAEWARPRATVRTVNVISCVMLTILALAGSYVAVYRTPVGQVVLLILLTAYAATLVWMRRLAAGTPTPRFLRDPRQATSTRRRWS